MTAMFDEIIVILVFVVLAALAVLALRAAAASLWIAAATLVIAFLLTPAIWLTSDLHLAAYLPKTLLFEPSEPFADYVLLYLPMSFFIATLIAACLTIGSRWILRALRADGRADAQETQM